MQKTLTGRIQSTPDSFKSTLVSMPKKYSSMVNMGTSDRSIRVLLGSALVYFGLISQSLTDSTLINVVSGLFGLTNLIAAAIRICPGYLLAGFSTDKASRSINHGSQTTEKSDLVDSALTRMQANSKQSTFESTFKSKLLLSITLPVALVLLIFSYLSFEQSKKHKLFSEKGAARAVAAMALDIESSGTGPVQGSFSKSIAAIVFHDSFGNRVPSLIEKLPAEVQLEKNILDQVAANPLDHGDVWSIGNKNLLKITQSLPTNNLHVSVFYDTNISTNHNISPLITRLGFTALLAIWLSGWAAYYVIKRYTKYVAKNTQDLNYRNTHDLLTGLPNRQGLEETLVEQIDKARNDHSKGAPNPFSILTIDIASFHYFNDTLGYKLGDELLKNIAAKLQHSTHAGETLFRLSGDVFCIITPPGFDANKATQRASLVQLALSKSMSFQNINIHLQCRIGVASYPEHSANSMDLLRLGVIASEHAKKEKKEIAVYDASKNTHSVKKLSIVSGLVSAIDTDELYMAYQPKINVESGKLHGVEALIRWEHPVYKNIPPFEFIAWAEKSGLINALTHRVLNDVEQQCARWRKQGYEIPIAINLSPINLQDDSILAAIKTSVTKGCLRNGLLELELTENAVVQESGSALLKMREMHFLGIPISIDDFGTGLASFSYLRNFPVSNLKIDRSFVNIENPDEHDQILLRSMIELGHNLNCVVTAEGVENESTLTLLKELGCDYAQGYHICRPTSADGVIDWLQENNTSVCDGNGSGKSYLRKVA